MQKSAPSIEEIEELADFLRILGNSVSLSILICLLDQPMCVCELVSALNHRQPLISQHLMQLRKIGIVNSHREGWNQRYFISSAEGNDFLNNFLDAWQSTIKDRCHSDMAENE